MILDVKTQLISLTFVSAIISLILTFYWVTRKTYFGFRLWVAGTLAGTAGYFFLVMREEMPLGLSIMASNLLFCAAAVLKLDGVRRFVKDRELSRAYYALPLLVTAANATFYFAVDDIAVRVLILSLVTSAIALAIAWHLIRYSPLGYHLTYYTSAGIHIFLVFAIMARAILWLAHADNSVFINSPYNTLYFLFMSVFEVASAFIFLLVTGQRTEFRLHDANLALDQSIKTLSKTMSELKTLRGILPFCSYCKKIRDDQGYWEKVDIYIHKYSGANISHGICPECMARHYPEEFAAICRKDQLKN